MKYFIRGILLLLLILFNANTYALQYADTITVLTTVQSCSCPGYDPPSTGPCTTNYLYHIGDQNQYSSSLNVDSATGKISFNFWTDATFSNSLSLYTPLEYQTEIYGLVSGRYIPAVGLKEFHGIFATSLTGEELSGTYKEATQECDITYSYKARLTNPYPEQTNFWKGLEKLKDLVEAIFDSGHSSNVIPKKKTCYICGRRG